MRKWRDEDQFDLPSCVVALGTFDGVHKGHQALIHRAMDLAKELDTACVVYTFYEHPLSVICPERAPASLTPGFKKELKLQAMGIDGLLMRHFTPEFAAMEPAVFLEELVKKLRVKGIVAGFNYTFGAGGRGDADLICAESERLGYRAVIVDAVMDGGDVVSSTLLRQLKEQGDMDRFQRLFKLKELR